MEERFLLALSRSSDASKRTETKKAGLEYLAWSLEKEGPGDHFTVEDLRDWPAGLFLRFAKQCRRVSQQVGATVYKTRSSASSAILPFHLCDREKNEVSLLHQRASTNSPTEDNRQDGLGGEFLQRVRHHGSLGGICAGLCVLICSEEITSWIKFSSSSRRTVLSHLSSL